MDDFSVGVFAIGVASSVVASVISALAVLLWRRTKQRKGHLAGWWWLITYPPPITNDRPTHSLDEILDTERHAIKLSKPHNSRWELTEPTGRPWSIEILFVRHSDSFFHGKMWRFYPCRDDGAGRLNTLNRRWHSTGRIDEDSVIDGMYWDDRGEGGHGVFLLWMVNKFHYCGDFVSPEYTPDSNGVKRETFTAPFEWIKIGSNNQAKIYPWLSDRTLIRSLMERGRKWWPRSVRRRVRELLSNEIPAWQESGAYASTISGDLTAAHAIERLKRGTEPNDASG